MPAHHRLPISARHAFALAFDLAVRRDALHSLAVPLALRLPWILTLALLPPVEGPRGVAGDVVGITAMALLGDYVVGLLISAMLRFRARSVYNTPGGRHATPALECYALGLRRLPWLFLTEVARNVALFAAGLFLVLPGLWLGFRLSMATEVTVLRGLGLPGAFAHSFRITRSRFERWLEMIVLSVTIVLAVWFAMALGYVFLPGLGANAWAAAAWFCIAALLPVIQYAWTFFYLRLEESDLPLLDVEPAYAVGSAPPESPARLQLVETPPHDEPKA